MRPFVCAIGLTAIVSACSDSASVKPDAGVTAEDGGPSPSTFDSGTELRVTVPDSGRVFVKLNPPAVVTLTGDPKASAAWDLAFEGKDVFTNGGPSGGAKAAAFGPLDVSTFMENVAPEVPFLPQDKPGGAFLDWYKYEGAPSHALWSRYHVIGVKDGARLWKVQILTYYGERDGAPITGLYALRYAELTAAGPGATKEIVGLDGTAGGATAPPNAPSECLDLGTGVRTMLAADAARASSAWHLCFRRQSIGVNGEIGGPRGVVAVDLQSDATAGEMIADVKKRTAEGEKAAFDVLTLDSFKGKTFRGDRIVSGFDVAWIDGMKAPLEPASAAWLALEASGIQKYLLGFVRFENPTTKSPGTVVMRIKPVKG